MNRRLLAAIFALLVTGIAAAQSTLYWNTTTSGAAINGSNWYNNSSGLAATPSGVGTPSLSSVYDYLLFDNPSTNPNAKAAATSLVSGSASIGVGLLTFNNTFNGTNSTTVANGSATNVYWRFASGWAIADNASNGNITFTKTSSGNFTFALISDGSISVASGATISFDSSVVIANQSGTLTGSITKGGGGTLTLAGTNTFGGSAKNFTLSTGTLNINSAAALGSSLNTFIISGGTIDNTSGSAITIGNYAQNWSGDFIFTGSNSLNLGTGAVALGASRQVTVSGNTLTVGGVISGSGFGLTKAGTGTLALTGNNIYTGSTTVSAGTLSVTGSGTLGGTSGAVSVGASGTLSVGSGVTIGNAINVAGALIGTDNTSVFTNTISGSGTLGGTMKVTGTVAPGNSPGIITVGSGGSLTFGSGSTYSWDLTSLTSPVAGTDYDQIRLLSGSSLDATLGTLVPVFGAGLAPNQGNSFWNSSHSFTIIDSSAGGTITGTFVATNSWGNGTFSTNATALNWSPTAIPEPATYAVLLGAAILAGAAWQRRRQPKPTA